MRDSYKTSVEAMDGFILNTHAVAKLQRTLKNKMNVKTSTNHKEFSHWQKKMQKVKNRVTSHNTSFFETIKSVITYKEEKKKTLKTISVPKEVSQALALFVCKCTDKKTAFHYPLTSYSLAIPDLSGKSY